MHTIKKLMQNRRTEKGFTLVEVIVTITVFAILASVFVTFMGKAITQSSDPVTQARNLGAASGSMETITAAYALYLSHKPTPTTDDWTAFKTACGTNCSTVASGGLYSANFETVQKTITTGNQKIVSYFMK